MTTEQNDMATDQIYNALRSIEEAVGIANMDRCAIHVSSVTLTRRNRGEVVASARLTMRRVFGHDLFNTETQR